MDISVSGYHCSGAVPGTVDLPGGRKETLTLIRYSRRIIIRQRTRRKKTEPEKEATRQKKARQAECKAGNADAKRAKDEGAARVGLIALMQGNVRRFGIGHLNFVKDAPDLAGISAPRTR